MTLSAVSIFVNFTPNVCQKNNIISIVGGGGGLQKSYLKVSFYFPYYSDLTTSRILVICVYWKIVVFGSFNEER